MKLSKVNIDSLEKDVDRWIADVSYYWLPEFAKLRAFFGVKVNKKVDTLRYVSSSLSGVRWINVDSGCQAYQVLEGRLQAEVNIRKFKQYRNETE